MPSQREIERAKARVRRSLDRARENGLLPPRNADKANPPAEDKSVPAGRNVSELKSRPNPPVNEAQKPEEQKKQEQEVPEGFAKHVSTHVAKQTNGLHGQLKLALRNDSYASNRHRRRAQPSSVYFTDRSIQSVSAKTIPYISVVRSASGSIRSAAKIFATHRQSGSVELISVCYP